jgi:nitrite reductase (cytochrome c-552)
MKTIREHIEHKPWLGWLLFGGTMVIVFFLGLLASSILERRAEAIFAYTPQVEFEDWEPRSEIWGQNFPRQYQSYLLTSDTTFASKHNNNRAEDMLAKYPEFVVLWSGYAFSRDYKAGRGHYYAITDVYNTLRTGGPLKPEDGPQPATCWTCKSPDVPRLMARDGVAEFYSKTLAYYGPEVRNFIGCADCHDAKTMNLRISRPGLVEAYQNMGKDIQKATHQEMRSLVCAQCHVEYYFDKKKVEGASYLVFPWHQGMGVEEMEAYYDKIEFSDWTHGLSKAPMLKAQHPDYELFTFGIHAQRGVACADCHMPFRSEGGMKFSDHRMTSPLNNVASTCQVCHREETKKLLESVYSMQDRVLEIRRQLERQLVQAHVEAKKAWELGATEIQMKEILQGIRKAQWRWDYVAASHGAAFHAPLESARIIGNGISVIQDTRLKLARLLAALGHNEAIPYPDIRTKEKAQSFIGMNMDELRQQKDVFLKTVVPKWIEEAVAREKGYKVTRM